MNEAPTRRCHQPAASELVSALRVRPVDAKEWRRLPFERYADDVVAAAASEVGSRLGPCGCHSTASAAWNCIQKEGEDEEIVYCKDANQQGIIRTNVRLFWGTFRPRAASQSQGKALLHVRLSQEGGEENLKQ